MVATTLIIEVSESSALTLEQIKWLESVCRKQRKRLKSNSGKCDKTIDMFSNENGMFEEKEDE